MTSSLIKLDEKSKIPTSVCFSTTTTGCFIRKVEISNGCNSGRFFQVLKICLHFSAVYLQFFKKSAISQTQFGFTNVGSNMHRYRATAISNFHFSNETPCMRAAAAFLLVVLTSTVAAQVLKYCWGSRGTMLQKLSKCEV